MGVVLLVGSILLAQDAAAKAFKPPRVAVVDIQQVFDLYDKKKDLKVEFEGEVRKADEKLKAMDTRLKQIEEELPNLEQGPKKRALQFEKFSIEQDGKELKEKEAVRLQKLELKFYQDMRDEITDEIQAYAKALDLDLVLEKTFNADVGPRASIRWAIVHFTKPELEITSEIAARLNSKYKNARPAPTVAPPVRPDPSSPPAPEKASPKRQP